jgi:hypothetical protein
MEQRRRREPLNPIQREHKIVMFRAMMLLGRARELCVELKSLDHGSGPNFDLLLAQWHRQDRNRRQRQHKEP